MAFYNKVYNYVKHENFDTWLKSVGVPDEKIAPLLDAKNSTKIVQNGDSYTITYTSPKGDRDSTFKSGVEFDDIIGEDTAAKTTYTVSGNTVTQQVKTALGSATFTREFNGDDLVVTITSDKYEGVAKRFYKA